MEAIKAALLANNEQLKSDLQRQNEEFKIRFSGFHSKVAETISETYSRLQDIRLSFDDYINSPKDKKNEKRESAEKILRDFNIFYQPKKTVPL